MKRINLWIIIFALIIFVEVFIIEVKSLGTYKIITLFVNICIASILIFLIKHLNLVRKLRYVTRIKNREILITVLKYSQRWLIILSYCFLVLYFASVFITPIIPSNQLVSLISSMITLVVIFYLTFDIYTGLFKIFISMESKKINNNQPTLNKSMYYWLEDSDSGLLNLYTILLNQKSSYDTLENMHKIKESIKFYCNNQLDNMLLLQKYIKNKLKFNLYTKGNVSISTIIGLIATIILKNDENIINFIDGFIMYFISKLPSNISIKDSLILIDSALHHFTIVVIAFLALLFIWRILTRNIIRLKLIDEVLTLLIEEKEQGR